MSRSLVDTHVLVYAAHAGGGAAKAKKRKVPAEMEQKVLDSAALLGTMAPLRVCDITWLEFLRGAHHHSEKVVADLAKLVQCESTTRAIMERARRILDLQAGPEAARCAKCQISRGEAPCTGCGRLKSAVKRINDAIILATAEELADVDVLYTYDNGILAMEAHMRVSVRQPPNSIGPLFEGRTG